MPATPQTQAISIANSYIALGAQLKQINDQLVVLAAQWTDDGTATTLNALGTVALNADGSTGASDGAPNVAHPINPTLGITRALSSNQIAQIKTICDAFVTLVSGSAVAAQTGARGILNSCVGG